MPDRNKMRQERIWKSQCRQPLSSPRSFLDLPLEIRHAIYREAGIPVEDNFGIQSDKTLRRLWILPSFTNLLLVSRAVHKDVEAFFYASNHFTCRVTHSNCLQALIDLPDFCLGSLTYLTVDLDILFCSQMFFCCSEVASGNCAAPHCASHDAPLSSANPSTQVLLRNWNRAVARLRANADCSRLTLRVTCDTDDEAMARKLLAPLLQLRLYQCTVRLNRDFNPALKGIARDTVWEVTQKRPRHETQPFRFMDLPTELRLRVLEFTDLITPLREIEWSARDGFYLNFCTKACEHEDCPPEIHKACRLRDCWDALSQGCFCSRRGHTVYPTCSSCWHRPTALFLVCRKMRQDSLAVFFAQNKFILRPSQDPDHRHSVNMERLQVGAFLVDAIPAAALTHLKHLEIALPPVVCHAKTLQEILERDTNDLRHAVAIMKSRLVLSKLTVSIYMLDRMMKPDGGWMVIDWAPAPETLLKILTSKLLEPLGEIGRLFIHLSWQSESAHDQLERELERLIIGPSYDAKRMGKGNQPRSQWLVQRSIDAAEWAPLGTYPFLRYWSR